MKTHPQSLSLWAQAKREILLDMAEVGWES